MKRFFLFLTFTMISNLAISQISKLGTPWSFINKVTDINNIDTYVMTPPDIDMLKADDELMYKFDKKIRIGVIQRVDIDANNYGSFDYLPNGDIIWRIKIYSKDAKALSALFDYYKLPQGVKLYVYNPDKTFVLGAYTSEINNDENIVPIQSVPGEEMILEFNIPSSIDDFSFFNLGEICYIYRDLGIDKASGSCNVNVACSEGANWVNQKNGVVKIRLRAGSYYYLCSGSLVNNTKNDCTPYILTADHCGYESSTNDLNYWIFYFNYEAGTCNGTTPIYYNHTVTGCTLVAHDNYGSTNSGSDFFLVKLKNNVPQNYNPYYNGWSRYTTPISTSGVGIHHPGGDIKKISTYQNTLYSGYSTHWRVSWVATANGHGITEGGSSGSPLFNSSGKIIGTLTSGTTSCDNLNGSDYYGKFSYHWASNGSTNDKKLQPWLDPLNQNPMELNGRDFCVVNIDDYEILKNSVNIYPNPARDYINININNPDIKFFTIYIYDILGNLIFQSDINYNDTYKYDVSYLEKGTYIIKITTDINSISLPFITQ
ncbi:MAG: T9SS type A sorting domain-containing protein [Bacteroidales bacterium]|jgi:uncharacterized protein (DUF2249 family)